ncbi:LytR/AlgR family response regulator transcription factor [Sphingobacterium faecale]|uniref:Response regulator n=1 Tax=Sphingobacterium faecale TaxID=2803775 RepID=A0ABS1R6N6_9SPHI|nr:response regulator [Sphingobacterium faecale]MBL1410372.1 response regulator [Sphingobacterium faecale]
MLETTKKVLLLDDEPAILDTHADLFKLILGYEIKTETNSIRAIDYIKKNQVDLLVFDVEMPGLNGLEMLPLLTPRPKLLMVTGYASYVVPGYLDDVDYCLTKPLLIPHLIKALSVIFKEEPQSSKVLRPKLVIKDKETHVELILAPDEISVIESARNDIYIYLIDGSKYTQRKTLEKMYDHLPKDRFVRIHRSFIIHIDNLITFNTKSYKIQMRGYRGSIGITDIYRESFLALYKRFQ